MPASVVNAIVNLHRAQLQGVIELGGVRRVRAMYEEARAELEAKLAAMRRAGEGQTFGAQHLRMVLLQVNDGLRTFQQDFGPELSRQARVAADLAQRHLVGAIKKMERRYSGVEPVLRIEEAGVFERVYKGVEPTLLHRHHTLMSAYSMPTIERVRKQLALSMLSNETVDQAVNRVAASGGIFDKERWRADRIVRTESSMAYSVVNQRCMERTSREIPDLRKRWVETMDNRTGEDSKELQGQTVRVDQQFVWRKKTKHGTEEVRLDGPPNRPNCRALVLPWRAEYPGKQVTSGPVTPKMP